MLRTVSAVPMRHRSSGRTSRGLAWYVGHAGHRCREGNGTEDADVAENEGALARVEEERGHMLQRLTKRCRSFRDDNKTKRAMQRHGFFDEPLVSQGSSDVPPV